MWQVHLRVEVWQWNGAAPNAGASLKSCSWTSGLDHADSPRPVHSATVREWKSSLPHEAVARIERAWGDVMRALGYNPVTSVLGDGNRTPLVMELLSQ